MKNIERKLHKIDATDQAIGRMASEIAILLRGKNKPEYEPYLDHGDMVEVSNIAKAKAVDRLSLGFNLVLGFLSR